jgi:hypothetical protein
MHTLASILALGAGPVVLLLLLLPFAIFLAPGIFYVLTLQKTLKKCAPESRTLEPGLLWLFLIPFVNIVFHFFIVLGMAKTLRNEFNRRGITIADPNPGQALGLAMCIIPCGCVLVPLSFVLIPAYLVLWIIYWVKMAGISSSLGETIHAGTPVGVVGNAPSRDAVA